AVGVKKIPASSTRSVARWSLVKREKHITSSKFMAWDETCIESIKAPGHWLCGSKDGIYSVNIGVSTTADQGNNLSLLLLSRDCHLIVTSEKLQAEGCLGSKCKVSISCCPSLGYCPLRRPQLAGFG